MNTFAVLSPPYTTLAVDPPWPFHWSGHAGGRRARATRLGYTTMSVDDIAALPVGDLAARHAHLYLWVTRELHREGIGCQVARAWGFEPFAEIIWRKPNFGAGAFPRPGHEPLLICRRGSLPFTAPLNIHSVQDWRQSYSCNGGKQHSAKPDGAMDLIERASPGPYVELFSRTPRLGWDSWGWGYETADQETG